MWHGHEVSESMANRLNAGRASVARHTGLPITTHILADLRTHRSTLHILLDFLRSVPLCTGHKSYSSYIKENSHTHTKVNNGVLSRTRASLLAISPSKPGVEAAMGHHLA